ncbi:hypothetical protein PENTCL1PPCAC_24033, partial [Pristionchus entomophagus]
LPDLDNDADVILIEEPLPLAQRPHEPRMARNHPAQEQHLQPQQPPLDWLQEARALVDQEREFRMEARNQWRDWGRAAQPEAPRRRGRAEQRDHQQQVDAADAGQLMRLFEEGMRGIRELEERLAQREDQDALDEAAQLFDELDWRNNREFEAMEDFDMLLQPVRQPRAGRAAAAETAAQAAARIKELRDVNESDESVALRYTRACTICLAANPRWRAVLVACGHMTCSACAEQLAADAASRTFE